MSLLAFFQWCEQSGIGEHIRRSAWLFPMIEAIHLLDPPESWPGSALQNSSGIARTGLEDWLVEDSEPRQLVALVALVANFEHEVLRQLSLYVE